MKTIILLLAVVASPFISGCNDPPPQQQYITYDAYGNPVVVTY